MSQVGGQDLDASHEEPCDSDSEQEGTSSSGSDSDIPEVEPIIRRAPLTLSGTKLVMHCVHKTLRLAFEEHKKILICGRQITDKFTEQAVSRWDSPTCRQCFKSTLVASARA